MGYKSSFCNNIISRLIFYFEIHLNKIRICLKNVLSQNVLPLKLHNYNYALICNIYFTVHFFKWKVLWFLNIECYIYVHMYDLITWINLISLFVLLTIIANLPWVHGTKLTSHQNQCESQCMSPWPPSDSTLWPLVSYREYPQVVVPARLH